MAQVNAMEIEEQIAELSFAYGSWLGQVNSGDMDAFGVHVREFDEFCEERRQEAMEEMMAADEKFIEQYEKGLHTPMEPASEFVPCEACGNDTKTRRNKKLRKDAFGFPTDPAAFCSKKCKKQWEAWMEEIPS